MSALGIIGARQNFFATHAQKRADHLNAVADHLNDVSATLSARGKDGAAENVAHVAARVTTRAARIEIAYTNHQPASVPPATDGDADGQGASGIGSIVDVSG